MQKLPFKGNSRAQLLYMYNFRHRQMWGQQISFTSCSQSIVPFVYTLCNRFASKWQIFISLRLMAAHIWQCNWHTKYGGE
ncbi:hypothetical protein FKM82_030987 [Ascaphus truei]